MLRRLSTQHTTPMFQQTIDWLARHKVQIDVHATEAIENEVPDSVSSLNRCRVSVVVSKKPWVVSCNQVAVVYVGPQSIFPVRMICLPRIYVLSKLVWNLTSLPRLMNDFRNVQVCSPTVCILPALDHRLCRGINTLANVIRRVVAKLFFYEMLVASSVKRHDGCHVRPRRSLSGRWLWLGRLRLTAYRGYVHGARCQAC